MKKLPSGKHRGALLVRLTACAVAGLVPADPSHAFPFDPSDDAPPDFATDLGVHVEGLVPMEPIPKDLLRRVAKRIGESTSFLGGARLYRGSIMDRSTGASVEGRFAEITLRSHGDVRLVLGIGPGGDALGIALWGTPEIDEDPTFRWSAFAGQLRNLTRGAGLSLETDAKESAPEAWKRALKKVPSKERPLASALVDHRHLMRGNTQMLGQFFMLQRAGSMPSLDWIERNEKRFLELDKLAKKLVGALSSSYLEAHGKGAQEALLIFRDMKTAAAEGDEAFLRGGFMGRLRSNCASCHGFQPPSGEADMRQSLITRLGEYGLPEGLLRLDYDVAPLDGADRSEAKLAQAFASAMRGALLLFDGLRTAGDR